MGDQGIMFQASQILRLLDRTKTQTRRIAKLPMQPTHRGGWEASTLGGPGSRTSMGDEVAEFPVIWNKTTGKVLSCPYGAIGDRLWVKETLELTDRLVGATGRDEACYVADGTVCPYVDTWPWKGSKLSPIYMPRGARRLEIVLTDVRAQRLLEITDDDARAEGVAPFFTRFPEIGREQHLTTGELAADAEYRASYAVTWDEINGDKALWISDPWVWALTFKVENRIDG